MALSLIPRGKHTRKGNNWVDLPSEALDAATCFIVYDGQAHFWAALRDCGASNLGADAGSRHHHGGTI
ncbi:TPA: hypothetical protein ACH3X1_011013 [Trebouxia sp. C0004]